MMERLVYYQNLILCKKGFFCAGLLLLILLLLRNPFSERTLISNLEPYPDTIHYIVPARSLAKGGPFKLTRGYGEINSNVAPLYSLFLAPFYLINSDPRMFYFANVLLSISSFYIFYRLADYLIENKWILGSTLFVYVTNYYVYWYPQWAMAENMTLTLFIGSLYLLTKKVNSKNIIFASFFAVSFYVAKYAYPSLTFVYFVIYLLKIVGSGNYKLNRESIYSIAKFVLFFSTLQLIVFYYQYLQTGSSPINSLVYVSKSVAVSSSEMSSAWFSSKYFSENLRKYINAMMGGSQRFLWDYSTLYPKWLFYFSFLGMLICLFRRKARFIVASMVFMTLSSVFLLSFFYTTDIRYIYHVIPVMIIGFGLFLSVIYNFLRSMEKKVVFWVTFIVLALIYLNGNILRIKNQVVLNLKYAEVPWYYKSVLVLNDYFKKDSNIGGDIYVISPMIPFYVDFYSNGNYKLLPLSLGQDFRNDREKIWGSGNYDDLINLYKDKLNEGNRVYVYTYGLGNEGYLHAAFNNIKNEYNLTEVVNSCFSQCILYKLENEKS